MATMPRLDYGRFDLEKRPARIRAAFAAAMEAELAFLNHQKANRIKRLLDVFFVVYLLFCVGVLAAMVMVSDNWWDPWPGVLIMLPIFIGTLTLYLTPKMKDMYIRLHTTKRPPGSEGDPTTKLLATEK